MFYATKTMPLMRPNNILLIDNWFLGEYFVTFNISHKYKTEFKWVDGTNFEYFLSF